LSGQETEAAIETGLDLLSTVQNAAASLMTRDEIEKHTVAFMRTAGGTRPDLRVVEFEGQKVVVKDFRRSDILFRLLIGPIMIRRERGALLKLRGVSGVPQFIQRLDRYAIIIEHIEGSALKNYTGPIPEDFFDKLADVMRACHEHGVVHCDLRSSGNVMITPDGEPKVVDFAACAFKGRGWNPFINFIFRNFVDADLYAVLMLKRKHTPEKLRPEELERLSTPLPYEKFAKSFGCGVRNITRKLLTRNKNPG
jgi:serine/threonine protein kinase